MNREIPFAGHPNVGTAFVLATQAAKPPTRLLFEEGAGLVPVEIATEQGRVVSTEFTAPQPLKRMSHLSAEQAASCLSLSASDVKADRHPPQIISVGLAFLAVELTSRDALRRAKPNAEGFAKTFPCDGSDAVYFYTRDVPAGEKPCELQARMFHPGASGFSEDPATGSATAACAALLADIDPLKDGELKLKIGQGVDMGRPSLLLTRVRKQNGAVASIHVGGGQRADDGRYVPAGGRGVRCSAVVMPGLDPGIHGLHRGKKDVDWSALPGHDGEGLHLLRRQILHLHAIAVFDDLGDPLPVALLMVALVAENADRTGLLHQRREFVEFFLACVVFRCAE